ncbi:MAG: hypothetical protein EOP73_27555, partial [Variovorax sp.]
MIYQSNRQAGGTVLGLIIGLIIGLAIAVGVAITIKNTPLPFVNKLGKQEKTPDRSPDRVVAPNTSNAPPPVAPTGPIDPNKPLYGNREAACWDRSGRSARPAAAHCWCWARRPGRA